LGRHRGWESVSHRRQTVRHKERLGRIGCPMLAYQELVGADIAGSHGLLGQYLPYCSDHLVRRHPRAGTGDEFHQVPAVRTEFMRGPRATRWHQFRENRKRCSWMRDQFHFRWIKLVAVGQGVNVDDGCLKIPGFVELHNVQPASNNEIRSLRQFEDELVSQHLKNSGKERMVLWDHAFGLGRYDDRYAQLFR